MHNDSPLTDSHADGCESAIHDEQKNECANDNDSGSVIDAKYATVTAIPAITERHRDPLQKDVSDRHDIVRHDVKNALVTDVVRVYGPLSADFDTART